MPARSVRAVPPTPFPRPAWTPGAKQEAKKMFDPDLSKPFVDAPPVRRHAPPGGESLRRHSPLMGPPTRPGESDAPPFTTNPPKEPLDNWPASDEFSPDPLPKNPADRRALMEQITTEAEQEAYNDQETHDDQETHNDQDVQSTMLKNLLAPQKNGRFDEPFPTGGIVKSFSCMPLALPVPCVTVHL